MNSYERQRVKHPGEVNEHKMQMTGGYLCEPKGDADGCLCEQNEGCNGVSL